MANIYGTFVDVFVTIDSDQDITGKKRFLNLDNEFDGTLVQPTILAEAEVIDTTELSFLAGASSNIQNQFAGINIVLTGLTALEQALQALEPSPALNVVQFNDTVSLINTSFSATNNMAYNRIDMNDGVSASLTFSIDTIPGKPLLGIIDDENSNLAMTATQLILNGSAALRPVQILLNDGTSSNTLSASSWSGDCAGSANSATYASSVNIADLATGSNYPVLFNSISTVGYNNLSMDVSSGNHFYYSPGTNKITVGGTTNGGLAISGTASTITVAGTGTAISAVNASAINLGSSTVTAGTFSGALSGLASSASTVLTVPDLTTASNCPVGFFVNTSGQQAPHTNTNLSFQPTTNTLRATTFEGALTGLASSATNVVVTSDNTNGNYYIPFAKTSGTGGKPLFIDDDVIAPLYYNPSTATLTTAVFVGGTVNGTTGLLLQYNGTTKSYISTNGVQETLLTTQGTATYSSPILTLVTTTLAPYPTTYGNIITFSGSAVAQTVSAITVPANMPINAMYYCYITNSNTSAGAITVNATGLGTGIKTTYTSAVIIPISGFALGTLTKVGAAVFIWSINVIA